MKTLTELTVEYYALIGGDHHKDNDCHFYIKKTYSYGDEPYWQFSHYGYCWSVGEFFENADNIQKYQKHSDSFRKDNVGYGISFVDQFPKRKIEQEAEQDMRNFLEWAIKKEKEFREREDAGD